MNTRSANLDARPLLLSDLGEFEVLRRVVFPLARQFDPTTDVGDDCSFIEVGGSLLAVSADVGPRPLVQQIPGYESDQEAAGWHAVVATASDIATAGAKPLLLTNTVDAPADLEVAQLEAFMEGYFRACRSFGFRNGGGDLRQGAKLIARVFGIGVIEHGLRVGRTELGAGDQVVLLGRAGAFIAAFLEARRTAVVRLSQESERTLRFPDVQLDSMMLLASRGLVSAASDSSDGVLGAVQNLSVRSGRGIRLELSEGLLSTLVKTEAKEGAYDPWNLFFFWGDWSVVAIVPKSNFDEFVRVVDGNAISWIPLGHVTDGPPIVDAVCGGRLRTVQLLRNENFVAVGFNAGVQNHVEAMLSTPIFADADSGV